MNITSARRSGIPIINVKCALGKVGQTSLSISYAKLKADLLVMGTTGKTGLKIVLGNAAEKSAQAQCDILALKR